MILYTINGVYPDRNFNFSVNAEDLGLIPEVHTHVQANVDGLAAALGNLSAVDHTHIMVNTLYSTTAGAEPVVVGISATEVSGNVTPTAVISGQTITLGYNSPETGIAVGIEENNPMAPMPALQLYGGGTPTDVTAEFSYMGLGSRNLSYKDYNYREFYNNVILADNESETRITRILDVTKTNGLLVPTEIYPCNAVRMFMSTNYDLNFYMPPKNSIYACPRINTEASNYQPLRVTVEPIPAYGCWRMICSENMTLPASATGVFSGTQTVSIPIIPDTEEEQERWVAAVPAVDDGWTPPVKFKFYVKPSATGGQGDGGSSGGEQQEVTESDLIRYGGFVDDVLYYWSFDNTEHPLIDNINGCSFSDYHNISNPLDHLATDFAVSGAKSLAGIDAGNQVVHILSNNTLYARMSALDADGRYGWYNEDSVTYVYTASSSPAANDALYADSTAATPLENVVEDCFTPNNNKWVANLDLVSPNDDFLTVSFYTKHIGSSDCNWTFKVSNSQGFSLAWGWKWNFGYGNGRNVDIGGVANLADDWKHFTLVLKKRFYPTDAIMQYDATRGFGLELYEGPSYVYQPTAGNRVSGYYRDVARDADSRYAWTYSGSATPEITTIWTDAESYAAGTWLNNNNDPHAFTTSDGTDKVNCMWRPFTMRMRNDRTKVLGSSEAAAAGPWYSDWIDIGDAWNKNNWLFLELWGNGQPLGFTIMLDYQGQNNTLELSVNDKRSRFDDIRVYKRALLASEIAAIASLKGEADAPAPITDTSLKSIGVTVENARTKTSPLKITVGDSVYYYDPDYTVFHPTTDDAKAARFGWRKISGTGADTLWTATLLPMANIKCYTNATDILPDANANISAVATLKPADVPLNLHLEPFIIDDQTVAIVVGTWDFLVNRMRALFPNIEALHYNTYQGTWEQGNYKPAGSWGFDAWETQALYQPVIRAALDDANNYAFDGNAVTIRGRWMEELSMFHPAYFQWRNCQPGDQWYVPPKGKNMWVNNYWNNGMDNAHVAFLRLGTPMTEGSTHTLTWCQSSCTFTFSKDHYSAAIKVNQEGYIAWRGARYAYLGRWLGSGEAWSPPDSNRTFYLLPATASATVSDAVFSGTMTPRCTFNSAGDGITTVTDSLNGKPIDGENCYQCDLSGFTSCNKATIVAGGTEYFRDIDADWDRATITTDNDSYIREPSKDTCNAWAWKITGGTTTVYTDTHFPVPDTDQIRDEWEPSDSTTYTDITGSSHGMMYGWTTERVTEADYGTAETVWTNTELASEGMDAYRTYASDLGSPVPITSATASKPTNDISGNYQVYVPRVGWSHVFNIGNQGFGHIFWVHARGLFHQRSGCDDVKHPYTNWEYDWGGHSPLFYGGFPSWNTWLTQSANSIWKVDPVTKETLLNEDGGKISFPASGSDAFAIGSYLEYTKKAKDKQEYGMYGGWFDAADFDMRPMHLYIPGYLAEAYIHWPQNFEDGQLDIPESGDGVPDILSEALWGMELYRKCQWPDGGVTAEMETSGHEKDWPWLSTHHYYRGVGEFGNTASYCSRAANLAYALRVAASRTDVPAHKAKLQKLEEIYTESCLRAWSYIEAEFQSAWVLKAPADRPHRYFEFQGGTYEMREDISLDGDGVNSETANYILQCAVSLFRLTRLDKFRPWITMSRVQNYFYRAEKNDNHWVYTDNLFALVKGIDQDFPEVATWAKNRFVSNATKWYNRQFQNTYRILYWKPGETWFKAAGWGCCHPDIRGTLYLLAYLATNDTKWLDALALAFDHVTGCNGLGRTWTAFLGKVYPFHCLDSHEPRNRVQRGLFGLRQGISPYLWSNPIDLDWDQTQYAIYPTSGTRGDFYGADQGFSYSMYPADANRKWGSITGNGTGHTMANTHWPCWRGSPCLVGEDIDVSGSEYVVDQTIGFKMMMADILMGPGFKPKPWYKQAAPAKGYYADPNWCTLP